MIVDKPLGEMDKRIKDLERRILSGTLETITDYKVLCGQRKIWQDAQTVLKDAVKEDDDGE